MRRLIATAVVVAMLFAASSRARAADPLNSNDRVTTSNTTAKKTGSAATNDFNFLPVAGGDTDIGIGAGYFANLVRVQKGVEPYWWNLASAGFLTAKPRDGGGVLFPYQDVYFKLTVPRLFGKAIRLEVQPEYTWETLRYYGIGNASPASRPAGTTVDYFEYVRIHPVIDAAIRIRIVDHLAASTALDFTQNVIQIKNGTRLDTDYTNGDPETKRLLGPRSNAYPIAIFKYGLQYDTRDNEVSPSRGTFDDAIVKLSPGEKNSAFPDRYGQVTTQLRAYVTLIPKRVVLAMRAVGDLMFGDVPFYELTRYADTYAIGGVNGVRGVPAQRYSGRVKVFGNAELRTELTKFHLFGKNLTLGAVGFFDGGRVWADTKSEPALDGRGIGLKYGVGAGARIKSNDTFVIRLDVAWSPDATPIGAYLAAGELF